jgi:hypothetical protein
MHTDKDREPMHVFLQGYDEKEPLFNPASAFAELDLTPRRQGWMLKRQGPA